MSLARRSLLVSLATAPLAAVAAPYAIDGPARLRPLAAKGVLLDVALAGSRLVAVGERGHVLLSDDQGAGWRQARAVPTRTTLTAVHAASDRQLFACGHGGVILASADAGENWTVAAGKADGPDVLLAIRVQADGRGLAVGSFGVALSSADGGRSWAEARLVEGEAGERHLNRLLVTPTGTWLIAAEGGQVMRGSGNPGALRWEAIKTPYAGSLWSGTVLPGGTLLLGGMRGNLVRSADDGRSWQHLPVAEAGSFTGCLALADGRPMLVGVDGTVVVGDLAAERFKLQRLADRTTLTGVVRHGGGTLIASSLSGMRVLPLPA